MPSFDQISDIITETSNLITPGYIPVSFRDKNALIKRLWNVFYESGLTDVCQELINIQKSSPNTGFLINFIYFNFIVFLKSTL